MWRTPKSNNKGKEEQSPLAEEQKAMPNRQRNKYRDKHRSRRKVRKLAIKAKYASCGVGGARTMLDYCEKVGGCVRHCSSVFVAMHRPTRPYLYLSMIKTWRPSHRSDGSFCWRSIEWLSTRYQRLGLTCYWVSYIRIGGNSVA